ncbi:unnamed protein product, partial [Oppiella nova]
MEATDGRGVDIVLNSLSGDKLDASYECVANSGRFVEIGRYDMFQNKKLGMFDFLRNIQFIGIGIDIVITNDMDFIPEFYDWVHKNSKNGCVKPITYTTFNVNEYDKAFRYMLTGKHMGKIVFKLRDEEVTRGPHKLIKCAPNVIATVKTFFDPNKVYIITGGLGGFGLELMPWMLYYGARKFVVTSRSGIKTDYQRWVYNRAKSFYEELAYFKCDYVVSTVDCLTIEGTQQLLKEAQRLGPIGGIFANLDQLTRKLDYNLDYFVVFSSMACGKGNGGQSNYSFGNSMCERICEQRRNDGLHGLAIQYGPVGDVGVFEGTEQMFQFASLKKQRINSCCDVLDKLLTIKQPIVTSYVKVDQTKSDSGSRQMRLIKELWRALGIDPDNTPNHLTLGEIGIESMFAVELQQELEREWNMKVTLNQVKSITIGMLKDFEAGRIGEIKKHLDDIKRAKANLLKMKFLIPTETHTRLNNVEQGAPIYVLPPLEVSYLAFEELAQKVDRPVIALNWSREMSKLTTLKEVYEYYEKLLKSLSPNVKFEVLGYFDGAIICTKLLRKQLAYKAVIVDIISEARLREDRLTDDDVLDILLIFITKGMPGSFRDKIMREIKKEPNLNAKVRLIVNQIVDFVGKGLVAPDMEEIFHIMFARIRMLSEYRMNTKEKFANRLKLAIRRKWAKKTGKLVVIKPFQSDSVDDMDDILEKARNTYFLPAND